MDIKRERRKVYLRCFALLLGLWLALAGVFSAYVLQNAWSQERDRFIQAADNLAQQLHNASDVMMKRSYNFFLLDSENADVTYHEFFQMCIPDKEMRENWMETDTWDTIVRSYEANNLVSVAMFTYEGEPYWQAARPGTVGLPEDVSFHDWGREPGSGDMPFTIPEFFDHSVMEEIHEKLETKPYSQLWLEAYCDGENYYPLTITLKGDWPDQKVIGSFESTRNLPDTPEKLREMGTYNGNLPKVAKMKSDGQWIEYGVIFSTMEQIEFEAICNGSSARLEDIAADPSRLMVYGVDYPKDHLMTDYSVDESVVQESAWSLLDRTYTAQVGAGRVITEEDPETSVVVSRPAYWLQLAGRSDVWSVAGSYWLATVLISLGGFLAAAWLLAYTTWRGQRTHLLYERRTRETTAAMAHDLKTPLAVIRACAENLTEGINPEKGNQYTQEITRQTAVMDKALLDMLELSRVDRHDVPLRPEEISWQELLDGRLEVLAPLLGGLDVPVEASGTVRADRAQLERLTDNLLRNALEHSDSVVRVQADERGLRVYNSGPPIPEEDLPRIWEPYFKGDAARKGGSGLGLALVAAIAKAHGWTCSAENRASGVEVSILFS